MSAIAPENRQLSDRIKQLLHQEGKTVAAKPALKGSGFEVEFVHEYSDAEISAVVEGQFIEYTDEMWRQLRMTTLVVVDNICTEDGEVDAKRVYAQAKMDIIKLMKQEYGDMTIVVGGKFCPAYYGEILKQFAPFWTACKQYEQVMAKRIAQRMSGSDQNSNQLALIERARLILAERFKQQVQKVVVTN